MTVHRNTTRVAEAAAARGLDVEARRSRRATGAREADVRAEELGD